MDKVKGALGNMKAKLNNKKIMLIVGLVILFAVLSYFAYKRYVVPKLNVNYNANSEFNMEDNQGNTAELLFFYADWCPHCKNAKPHWDRLSKEYDGKQINKYLLKFTKIDCSNTDDDSTKQMLEKYQVEGFPTIKLLKGNQVIEYDAKPNYQTLLGFLKEVLSN